MATLADKVNTNTSILKRGGTLEEVSQETLQQRVREGGALPGAAASPFGAASFDVTPDQAKMAGSSAQLGAVLRDSVRRRDESVIRTTATEEEKAKAEKAKQLSGLENLDDRLQGIIRQAVDQQVADVEVGELKFDEDKFKSTYPDADEDTLNAFKDVIATAELTPEGVVAAADMQRIADLLGVDLTALEGEALTSFQNEIKGYITGASETVADLLADTLGPDVLLSALSPDDLQALGFVTEVDGLGALQKLGALLGVTEVDELKAMSINDLQQRVDNLLEADYDRIEDLTRIANDPFYPENLRRQAQMELRELSATGVRAIESQMDRLQEQVRQADEITIGDKSYTMSEFLNDENITSLVAAYFEDPDGDFAETLKEEMPELYNFIIDNEAAFKNLVANLDEGVKTSAALQVENGKLNTYKDESTGESYDLSGVNAIMYDDPDTPEVDEWSTVSDTAIEPMAYHNVLRGTEFSNETKQKYASFLTEMAKLNPEILKDIGTLDAISLRDRATSLGFTGVEAYLNSVKETETKNVILNDTSRSSQAVVTEALGGEAKLKEILDLSSQMDLFESLDIGGITNKEQFKQIRDVLAASTNDDGSINYDTLREELKTLNTSLGADPNATLGELVQRFQTTLASANYQSLWEAASDGLLTADEAADLIAEGGLSPEKMLDLISRLNKDSLLGLGEGVDNAITSAIQKAVTTQLGNSRWAVNVLMNDLKPDMSQLTSIPYSDITRWKKAARALTDTNSSVLETIKGLLAQTTLPSYVRSELGKIQGKLKDRLDYVQNEIKKIEDRESKKLVDEQRDKDREREEERQQDNAERWGRDYDGEADRYGQY